MMKILILGLILVSVGCDKSTPQNAVSGEQHKELYNAVSQPLEKAKDVEQQILDNAEQQRKQAEAL